VRLSSHVSSLLHFIDSSSSLTAVSSFIAVHCSLFTYACALSHLDLVLQLVIGYGLNGFAQLGYVPLDANSSLEWFGLTIALLQIASFSLCI
jgi:hypothetical protein